MLAKYKVKQNCFFNFRNFKEGEIVLVEEEMGRKMKSLLQPHEPHEPHERREKNETRGQTNKPKSKSDIRKPVSAVSRGKSEPEKKPEPEKKSEPEKNNTSGTVNYSEQLTFEVDDKRTAKNGGNLTKQKSDNAPAQNDADKEDISE